MAWQALAAGAAPIIGGLIGQAASQGSANEAEKLAKQAAGAFSGISAPDIEAMKLALEQYAITGEYNPLVEQALSLGPSAMEDVQVDPRLQGYQMSALQSIADKANTGLSQADLAAFELAKRDSASQNQAKQGQILQEMAARGMGGSGAELIARLQSNQASTNALQDAQLQQAVAQEQARMAALESLGNQSSQVRAQDYGEQSDLAKARDLIQQYNTANSQSVNQRNIASRNQAQQMNLGEKQRIADTNVGTRNQQQQFNKGLLQQDFNNQLALAGGKAGATGGLANFYGQQAQNTQNMYSGIGAGIGQGINAYSNYQQNQAAKKPAGTT